MILSAVLLLASAAHALVHGVDSSTLLPTATYSKAHSEGFTKAVIRGYQEACGSGGRVDPNFVPSYNNAKAAGYTNIDTYWLPCNGSGNKCKSYAQQLGELQKTIKSNNMQIGRIWVDIEKDNVCNNWNYGQGGNLREAGSLISALRASGVHFGIYSSAAEWGGIFGSHDAVVDSSVPLWFATYDRVEDLHLKTPFGGWTSAFGKQYSEMSASGKFNLNVFSS